MSGIEVTADVEEVDRADATDADATDADPDEVVALYVRVSTTDQSLDRQRQLTHDYATDRLGVAPSSIRVYTDKRSGTSTDRSGYADLMADLASGEIDRVVVSEVSRLSRSVRDFAEAVRAWFFYRARADERLGVSDDSERIDDREEVST